MLRHDMLDYLIGMVVLEAADLIGDDEPTADNDNSGSSGRGGAA